MFVNHRKRDYEEKAFGIRHLQCGLIFFALAVSYAQRVNMSVAIVAMTDKSAASEHGVYPWTEKTKSFVLSSFFWGYVATQIPSGQLAHKYGGKIVLFWGMTISSALSILTPICAKLGGWQIVCILRIMQGLCQGSAYPSTHNLISKWAPVKERGVLGTICYSGTQFGTALMLCVSGEIASSNMGWPGIFYTAGGIGIIWGVLWHFFSSSSPAENSFISEEEKMYIEMLPIPSATEDAVESPKESKEEPTPKKLPTPWLDILTSLPFYCILVAHSTNAWGYLTLLTQIPTYFKNVLEMDIKRNAFISSLPYWTKLMMSIFFLFISEVLRKKQSISLAFSRKFFNTIGNWIPMIGLIGMGFMSKDNETLVTALLMMTLGSNAACFLGFQLNHIDLSPNFAGTLMGITNCAANIMSIIAPLVVGFVVTDVKNPEQWKIIFFITAGFYFVGNLMFILFGKVQTQYWNEPKPVAAKMEIRKSQNSVYMEKVH